ncbi:MAG: hypothetical protein R3D44_04750 [Hyphomicrobiaceae bacterium]
MTWISIIGAVRDFVARMKLKENSEWGDYGSGTASFFDIWVYRDEPAFRRPKYDNADHSYTGLWILLCRLAPFYVMGEGEKSWSATNGGRYMPAFNGVDAFNTPEVENLARRVADRLDALGLTRLSKNDVTPMLPSEWRFQSNLALGPLRIFDALFHWND